ncbi:patatin-like phospholipase family protein [Mesoaciditoga lauensis]|uniref:patatin-like phospholipase family protein n=1 Tax=Mesoaciditoga lauensis TaxID=1495039 RepID=UPI00056ADEB2|nr:patatin-like phospholipase family protein [Mesoaciditoga lauensis]
MNKPISIAFGGAGAFGLSYIGVVKYFQQHAIVPDELAGTSMGAIIASFWSIGLSWQEMRFAFENIRNWWIWAVQFWEISDILDRGGIADTDIVMNELLKPYLPKTWDRFRIPLFITTTNLTTKRMEVFSKTNPTLSPCEAVYASMAVPLAFRGLRKNGGLYFDGGIVSQNPVELLNGENRILVAPMKEIAKYHEPHGLLEIGMALAETMFQDASESDLRNIDYKVIYSGSHNIQNFLDFSYVDENIELGYQNAKKFFEEVI